MCTQCRRLVTDTAFYPGDQCVRAAWCQPMESRHRTPPACEASLGLRTRSMQMKRAGLAVSAAVVAVTESEYNVVYAESFGTALRGLSHGSKPKNGGVYGS